MGRQVVLLDETVRPHEAHEPVFGEDGAASIDEGDQRIERPATQLDRSTIHQQFPAMADDFEPAEFDGDRNLR